MISQAKLNEDDLKFVEATFDDGKRQERIERLSRSRRILNLVSIIQAICFGILALADVVAHFLYGTKLGTVPSPTLLAMIVLFCALNLHTDLQIKFLKASAAAQTSATG